MFGKIQNYRMDEQKVRISFENGEGIVEVITDEIINVFAEITMKGHRSKAVSDQVRKNVDFNITKNQDSIVIQTRILNIEVSDDFKVDFYKKDGTLLCADYRGGRVQTEELSQKFIDMMEAEGHNTSDIMDHEHRIQVIKKLEGDEAFYGLGDKTGFLNKRNYSYINWNVDIPFAHNDAYKSLYKSIPFFMTLRKRGVFGIFFDNTYKSWFDLGKENDGYYYFGADEGNLDYYFIYGENIPEVVNGYTELTGRAPLPQLWTADSPASTAVATELFR